MYTFHAAVIRQDAASYPEGGYQMENAVSREDALKAMTIWAAFSSFEEKEKGSIEVGKKADFTVLKNDLMTTSAKDLRSIEVHGTFIGGEKVFGE